MSACRKCFNVKNADISTFLVPAAGLEPTTVLPIRLRGNKIF